MMDGRQNSIPVPELELVAMGLIPELVPLEAIDPNPWQVRGEDAAHVSDLARDIAESRLLQPGMGRRVGERVQLAFGHSRLAAYRYLNETSGPGPDDQPGTEFARFPVVIRPLEDQQMAEFAITENFKRRDLSGIEKARALQRYCVDFGKTQGQAGERFNLTQPAVSHLLRLLELPEAVQGMVDRRELPERIARQLVGITRVAPKEVEGAAQRIVAMDEGEREEETALLVSGLLEEHARLLNRRGDCYWPMDWKPEEEPAGLPCKACPLAVEAYGEMFCTDPAHFDERKARWLGRELQRVSAKFGIETALPEEARPLKIGYAEADLVKAILKRKHKPECLRLLPAPATDYTWNYHFEVLGSQVVVLGSMDPSVLQREQAAKEGRAQGQDVAVLDDEALPTTQREAEEAEREARREGKGAVRRAQYDIPWLIFYTSEMCGDQLQVNGKALEWMADLVRNATQDPMGWPQYEEWREQLEKEIQAAKGKALESLVRRQMLVERLADAINLPGVPDQQYDWTRALENVQIMCDDLDLTPGAGWNEPPVWTTETNCHVCGRFTSMDHVTKRDEEEGWETEGGVVTCSDECRGKMGSPKVAKGAKLRARGKRK